MKLNLVRYVTGSKGTFGSLTVDGKETFYTVEKPYVNNTPYISSIPAGTYKLIPHDSPSRGRVLCLVGGDVTHYKDSDNPNNRFAILIHVANYSSDVEGCIGLGTSHTDNMVTHSRAAIAAFYGIVSPHDTHTLTITEDYDDA